MELRAGSFDSLTNLFNRYFLYEVAPTLLKRSGLAHSEMGLLMLDIDNFKEVNDTYGHLIGDSVLKQVSDVLRECVRKEDIIVRYGGDEFIILLQDVNFEILARIKFQIAEAVSSRRFQVDKSGGSIKLTVSGGLAIYPHDAQELEGLIEQADKALYFSKESGKNKISSTQEVIQKEISQRQALSLFPCPKLIGREEELGRLKKLFSLTLTTGATFVLVKGKFGIGKKRLLEEFISQLPRETVLCCKITARERYTQPYYALCKSLEDLFNRNNDLFQALAASLSDEEIEALAELITHFADFLKDKPRDKSDMSVQRKRICLFKGLRNIILELSQFQHLCLCFFDIQWLDKATLELLNYFLNWESVLKIFISATLAEEGLEERRVSDCKDFLSRISNKDKFFVLQLHPLSLEQSRELIEATLGQTKAPDQFYQSLYQVSEGNPLFLQECLKYLIEIGELCYRDGLWQVRSRDGIDIPSSLQELLRRRFRSLDAETKEMLIQAAVMGDNLQLEVMRRAVKKNQGYIFELLDRARKKGFIGFREQDKRIDFANPLIQKVIYSDLDTSFTKNSHFNISQIIEELYKSNPQEVMQDLVYHYEKVGDEAKAKEYRRALSEYFLRLFNADDLDSYIEEIKELSKTEVPSSVKVKKIETEISQIAKDKVAELIRFIILAIEKIKLYPQGNVIIEVSVDSVYKILKEILKEMVSLTLAEAQGVLLVNTQRLSSREEKLPFIGSFIALLKEREIKGLQFLPPIRGKEVRAFLNFLSLEPDEIREKGGIGRLIEKAGIRNIKLDITEYKRLSSFDSLGRIKERVAVGTMFLEFLGGDKAGVDAFLKALKEDPQNLAQNLLSRVRDLLSQRRQDSSCEEEARILKENIETIAKRLSPQDLQNYRQDIINLISFLDPNVTASLIGQTKVATAENSALRQLLNSFSEEEIIQIIMRSGSLTDRDKILHNIQNLLHKFSLSPEKKERIGFLLKRRLSILGLNDQELDFLVQKDYFNALSLPERIKAICQISPSLYPSIGIENLRDLIKQLISDKDKESLKKIAERFLLCLREASSENKNTILEMLGDFISSVPFQTKELDPILEGVFSALVEQILGVKSYGYNSVLDTAEKALRWLICGANLSLSRLGYLRNLLCALYQAMESKDTSTEAPQIKQIEKLLSKIPRSELIEFLLHELKDTYLVKDTSFGKITQDILLLFRDISLPMLIDAILQTTDISLKSTNYRYRISQVLKKMGRAASEEIKNRLFLEKDPLRLRSLIELAAYMKEETLIEPLAQFVQHFNHQVREEVAFAINYIKSAKIPFA